MLIKLTPMINPLPKEITAYDLLKTFALITMIVDHVGFYFFPDMLWWRCVGRLSAPVWFFLVGYARGRDVPPALLLGGLVLILGNIVTGMSVFAINALFTIGIIRLSLDPVMRFALRSRRHLWTLSALLFICIIPSYFLTEYGTQALIIAMFGYFVRHKQDAITALKDERIVLHYMLFALLSFIVMQHIIFGFTPAQFVLMAAGTSLVWLTLYYFEPRTLPKITAATPRPLVWITQLCGRRTLEIYVLHLLAFKVLAMVVGLEGFGLFDWSWFEVK